MKDREILPSDFEPPKVSKLKRFGLSFGILIAGFVGMNLIASVQVRAGQRGGEPKALLVEIQEIVVSSAQSRIEATGTLSAVQQISLLPEVSGRVVWVSDRLQAGAHFDKGEVLARIDSGPYKALLAQDTVRLKQAELEHALEQERARRAEQDWARLGDQSRDGALAKRTHHLELAAANVAAAQAAFSQSERNLARTDLRAPFNAVVIDERLDVGQVVGPGIQVASLAGRDRFRSTLRILFDQIESIAIPGVNGVARGEGSPAILSQRLGMGANMEIQAKVVGLGGQIDPLTRMATLLLDVDPTSASGVELPLLLGSVHQVFIQGDVRENALRVPRSALYEGDKVWTVDAEDKLQMARVRTGWDLGEDIEIREGLSEGDRIVVSPLSLPIEGTPVRLNSQVNAE
jgi:RND family efflux transporter MFP subunit